MVIFLGLVALLGLYMAWTIGANDFANCMASSVGSKAISVRKAVILGAFCEFAGSVLVGMFVADTVRKGIVDPSTMASLSHIDQAHTAAQFALGMACALFSSALWLHLSTLLGLPVSTTHAIVGAVAGFGMIATGLNAGFGAAFKVVEWRMLGSIVASWFISPVAGLVTAYLLFKIIHLTIFARGDPLTAARRFSPVIVFCVVLIVSTSVFYKGGLEKVVSRYPSLTSWFTGLGVWVIILGLSIACTAAAWIIMRRKPSPTDGLSVAQRIDKAEQIFTPLVVVSSCSVAFAHGANDVANAIGPLAACVDIVRTGKASLGAMIPFWVLALGGVGIVIGLATYGYRVMDTMGNKITQLTPSRGVVANISAAVVVLFSSRLKLPISTTHTIVGAILGIGLARGLAAVNKKVTRNIFGSWLITVPAAALLAVVLFVIGKLCRADVWIMSMFPT